MSAAAYGGHVLEFTLTEARLGRLKRLVRKGASAGFWAERGVEKVDLYLKSRGILPANPETVLRDMGQVLDSFSGLRLHGFPYCLLGGRLLRDEYLVADTGTEGSFKGPSCSGR